MSEKDREMRQTFVTEIRQTLEHTQCSLFFFPLQFSTLLHPFLLILFLIPLPPFLITLHIRHHYFLSFFSLFFLSFSYTQTFLSFFPRSSSCFRRFSFPFVVTSFSVLIVHLFPFSPLLPVSFLFLVSFPLIPNTSSPFPFLSHPYFFSVFFPPLSPTHVYSSSLFFHCSPSSFMHFSLCASSPSF